MFFAIPFCVRNDQFFTTTVVNVLPTCSFGQCLGAHEFPGETMSNAEICLSSQAVSDQLAYCIHAML